MSKTKQIIDLNKKNGLKLKFGHDQLTSLIGDRLVEMEKYEGKKENFYKELKRHDAILIDGIRGAGKTTLIDSLKSICDIKKAYVLDTIDPNQLDVRANILDIIITQIFTEVEDSYKPNENDENYSNIKTICRYKGDIGRTIFDSKKAELEDVNEKFKTAKGEMLLDKTIHKFADEVCKFFNTEALILPIDDVDMSLDHGLEIVETIKKYLQTPKIIPVVALNSSQIYGLVKQHYFLKFKLKPKTAIDDIGEETDLLFLKKISSEYIQKILPPSQRIVLPDMLAHYKQHQKDIESKKEGFEEVYFRYNDICLSFSELLKLIMSIVFESSDSVKDPDNYRIANYLRNKTFRSFSDDAIAVLSSLKLLSNKEERYTYEVDLEKLRTSFSLYKKSNLSTKYDSSFWFWNTYTNILYKKIDEVENKKKEYENIEGMQLNIVKSVLIVDADDAYNLKRKEKMYHRLFLQDFYLRKIKLTFNKDEESNVIKITKEINLPGYFEFILRTVFPALIFEYLYNTNKIRLSKFPIEKLTLFSQDSTSASLVDLYDNFLPYWAVDFGSVEEKERESSLLGFEIPAEFSQPYRKHILHISSRYSNNNDFFEYAWLPFKFFIFIFKAFKHKEQQVKSNKENDDQDELFLLQFMPKAYLSDHAGRLKHLKRILGEISAKNNTIQMEDTLFGITSAILSYKTVAENIINITARKEITLESYKEFLQSYTTDKYQINTLYRAELEKILATIEAIFINGFLINFLSHRGKNGANSHISEIHKDEIYAGIKKQHRLLPLINDDPFVRNISLLTNIEWSKKIDSFLTSFMNAGHINKYYLLPETLICKLGMTGRQIFIKHQIKERIEEERYGTLYLDLIKKYINSRKEVGKIFNDNVDNIRHSLKILKDMKELENKDAVNRNIAVLLCDCIEFGRDESVQKIKDYVYQDKPEGQ